MSDKKTVLITGGTRGIGEALVDHYATAGWSVISTGRTEESVAAASKQRPLNTRIVNYKIKPNPF